MSKIRQDIWGSNTFAASAVTVGVNKQVFDLNSNATTLCDTNIKTPNRVPYKKVYVYGIQSEIYRDGNVDVLPGTDFNAAVHNLELLIMKNNARKIFKGMLHRVPAGNDVTGSYADPGATTTSYKLTNGTPLVSQFFPLLSAEEFTENDTLTGTLTVKAAWTPATAFRVRITLLSYIFQEQA